jgi:hypothetical protein
MPGYSTAMTIAPATMRSPPTPAGVLAEGESTFAVAVYIRGFISTTMVLLRLATLFRNFDALGPEQYISEMF